MNDRFPDTTIRDKFWRGIPQCVTGWAALTRDGTIMHSSVRARSEDVKLSVGDDCVPIRVVVTYWPDDDAILQDGQP